jgi:glycosyltransferase involved in cell wall biosynthesis
MKTRIAIDCRKIADFGIGSYLQGLLSGLQSIDGDEEYTLLLPEELHGLVPKDARFQPVHESSGRYSVEEMIKVGRRADRAGASLFHAPHYVVPFTNARVVVTIHDLIHLHHPLRNPLAPVYARWMIRRATRRAERIITVTEAVARQIREEFPRTRGKVGTVHNGIDEAFRSPASRGLERLGLREGTYFLFAGNPKPHKNRPVLLAAFRRFRRSRGDLRLVIAGTSAVRSDPGRGIVATGLLPRNDLASLYAGAIALVQPSLDEGFGLPVVEAMAAGTAVVMSSIPALIEVGGDAAWRIDPYSIDSLEDALSGLAGDDHLRSLERSKRYSWQRCAEQTLEVYRSVMRAPVSR